MKETDQKVAETVEPAVQEVANGLAKGAGQVADGQRPRRQGHVGVTQHNPFPSLYLKRRQIN